MAWPKSGVFVRLKNSARNYNIVRSVSEKSFNVGIESESRGRDFAIVGRIFGNATGQISAVAAGLGAAGTTVASEFELP